MEPIRAERVVLLRSSPEDLWPLVSNTDRLNKALGLPAATSEPIPGGFDRSARARLFGLTVAWRERPFDFTAPREHTVVREFSSGPAARFEGGIRLEPDGSGARGVVHASFTPSGPLGALLLRLGVPKSVDDMAALLLRLDDSLARPGALPPLPKAVTPGDRDELSARAARLRAMRADPAAVERLIAHLSSAPDDEVLGLRPFELADRWGLDRLSVLGSCLHAVKAGLLDMNWEVLCPNCAGAGGERTLLAVKPGAHCTSCGVDFGVGLDETVELRFSIHPSVRAASRAVYCVGSPAHSPHALAQRPLAAGVPREAVLDLAPRSYTVRGLAGRRSVRLRPRADAPSALAIDLTAPAEELWFRPGRVTLALRAAAPELARVEAESWREAGATAALVTSLQEFRDLFSSEVLSPGHEIGVKRLALLFTDLKGSTALYERVGDATAYGVVRDHFDYLKAIVASRHGAVVKTIGDAVMAVFASGADALEAALDMQERIAELDAALAPRAPVVLKIGVHEGPAIAINAGGVLDYFGTTANLAARVQNESEGGDVVITEALRDDPSAAAVLARRAPPSEEFSGELKGLTGARRLWRLRPAKR